MASPFVWNARMPLVPGIAVLVHDTYVAGIGTCIPVSADATLVAGDISMTMRFTFDEAGLIASILAEARGALVDGKIVMLPWRAACRNTRNVTACVCR